MSHQSDCEGDKAHITHLTPEPETKREFSKSGIPLHMMRDGLQIEENIAAEDMPDMGIEEALTTL
tara:strand:- start:608 stop:802 length:195 start_codon:yes stop_codon:yes gene_type:complete